MQNPSLPLSLPEELIQAILLRLPVRSLLRLKLVCKSWLSFISDPNFAKSHYDLASEPTHRFLFISTSDSEAHSMDIEASLLDDHDSPVLSTHVLPHPFSQHQVRDSFYKRILVYGSCRGFLLLDDGHCDLLVWNPTTGVRKPISYSHVKFTGKILYGFGYDASTHDYLVLLTGYYQNQKPHIEIFSFKTNSWDQIEGFKFPYSTCGARTEVGLLLNGALHWLVSSRVTYNYVIIAYDLIERSLLEIPTPHDIHMESTFACSEFHLRVMGGCLCLCYPGNCHDAMAEIWIMKEYKVHSSWTKSFVLPTYDIPHYSFLPICFTKSEGLFGSNCRGELVKFNSRGFLIEYSTGRFDHYLIQSSMYRESLLSLPEISPQEVDDT